MGIVETNNLIIRDNRFLSIIIQFVICIGLASAGLIYYYDTYLEATNLVYLLCCFTTFLFFWIFFSWWITTGKIFDPYGIFLLAAILFNGGQIVLEVFDLNVHGLLGGRFSNNTLVQTIFLVDCSLSMFHLGALIAWKGKNTIEDCSLIYLKNYALRKVGLGLVLISVFPLASNIRDSLSIVMSGGYSALYQIERVVGIEAASNILGYFLIPGALFMLAGSDNRLIYIRLSVFIVVLYSTMQFVLGYRGWASMPLIALAWIWQYAVRPLSKFWVISFFLLFLLVIYPLVSSFRNTSINEREISLIAENYFSIRNPAVAVVSEMGGSLRTVAYTIELVPVFRDFDKGIGYLYALLTVFPNLWEGVHPTIARGLPSRWITETIDPYIASKGGGYGFSFIAEAYLNFGFIGGPIFLFVLGYFFARLAWWVVESRDIQRIAMLASFLAFFLYFARGELSSVIRQLVWYSYIPYLCSVYLVQFSIKRTTTD